MTLRVALDTNILVYADAGDRFPQDGAKWRLALDAIERLLTNGACIIVPVQVLVEFHDVLVRQRRLSHAQAALRISGWRADFETRDTTAAILEQAGELATQRQLRIFDAVILAAAADAGCSQLLTEDFHAGFVWRGVEVVNPFV